MHHNPEGQVLYENGEPGGWEWAGPAQKGLAAQTMTRSHSLPKVPTQNTGTKSWVELTNALVRKHAEKYSHSWRQGRNGDPNPVPRPEESLKCDLKAEDLDPDWSERWKLSNTPNWHKTRTNRDSSGGK